MSTADFFMTTFKNLSRFLLKVALGIFAFFMIWVGLITAACLLLFGIFKSFWGACRNRKSPHPTPGHPQQTTSFYSDIHTTGNATDHDIIDVEVKEISSHHELHGKRQSDTEHTT